MELYPSGPWKKIAHHIKSRTPRQVMTHAQKYRQRIKRRSNCNSRRKTKTTQSQKMDSVFSKSEPDSTIESAMKILKSIGVDELGLWSTPLEQDVCLLESLPHSSGLEPPQDFSVIDSLLLDEMQQFCSPCFTRGW
ncbi:hypothetical protein PHMEG_00022832 [Phytophthora megakarya]|uniref:HTH myb-type domain-containing protein n=1 Tax=Phytophthora megakarya TaxID=4795 RepID=A0A225VJ48_9STRA|nr:hypothetical protein PHMEG_00022832 [Phytophthora megakarya]